MAQGRAVHQTQRHGVDLAAAAVIFKAMRGALSDVDDPYDRDDAEHAIQQLQDAVEDDAAEVQTRAGRLQGLATRTGSTALATATTGRNELLQMLALG